MVGALRERWLTLTRRLSVPDEAGERWWCTLHAAYSEPHRYYHTLEHLSDLLRLSDAHARIIEEREAVELAIWFHDVVYEPRSAFGANEDLSADLFCAFAAEAGCLDGALVERVGAWIRATKAHACSAADPHDCRLFVDMDMAVLAREPAQYDSYAAQVAAEYAHLWRPLYWYGRAAFLGKLATASRPVYATAPFAELEAAARANCAREARALRGRLATSLGAAAVCAAVAPLALLPPAASAAVAGAGAGALARGLGAAALAAAGAHWAFAARGFVAYPYASLPRGTVAVFAASFNPPHAGHLALLRALCGQYEHVHALVSTNAAKVYAVSGEARAELLAEMLRAEGLRNATAVSHAGYVWRYALSVGAECLYRGVRTWASDGVHERSLEALNYAGPLLLGPLKRPVPTRFLGADPRYAHVSSSLVRRRLREAVAASSAAPTPAAATSEPAEPLECARRTDAARAALSGLLPEPCVPAAARLYAPAQLPRG